MVLTLVPVISRPWITSGDAKRSVTRRFAGTAMQRGTNMNWVAMTRTVTAAVGADGGAEIVLGEFAREMQRLGVDPLDIARRIDAHRERREQDHAQRGGDEDADAERPQQFGSENSALMHFGGCDRDMALSPPCRAGGRRGDRSADSPRTSSATAEPARTPAPSGTVAHGAGERRFIDLVVASAVTVGGRRLIGR